MKKAPPVGETVGLFCNPQDVLQLTAQYALLPEHGITLPSRLPFVFSN